MIGLIKGDTRSLDYSSYMYQHLSMRMTKRPWQSTTRLWECKRLAAGLRAWYHVCTFVCIEGLLLRMLSEVTIKRIPYHLITTYPCHSNLI